jgi:toxin CcdB
MTRQLDVYLNPLRLSRALRPYLIDVQHSRYSERQSRVVVPLVIEKTMRLEQRLNPVFQIGNDDFALSPTEIFTIPRKQLGEVLMNLNSERDRILAALDLVFTGI